MCGRKKTLTHCIMGIWNEEYFIENKKSSFTFKSFTFKKNFNIKTLIIQYASLYHREGCSGDPVFNRKNIVSTIWLSLLNIGSPKQHFLPHRPAYCIMRVLTLKIFSNINDHLFSIKYYLFHISSLCDMCEFSSF